MPSDVYGPKIPEAITPDSPGMKMRMNQRVSEKRLFKIALVGSGLIGTALLIVFARYYFFQDHSSSDQQVVATLLMAILFLLNGVAIANSVKNRQALDQVKTLEDKRQLEEISDIELEEYKDALYLYPELASLDREIASLGRRPNYAELQSIRAYASMAIPDFERSYTPNERVRWHTYSTPEDLREYILGCIGPKSLEEHPIYGLFVEAAHEAAEVLLAQQAYMTEKDLQDFMAIDTYAALILKSGGFEHGRRYLEHVFGLPLEQLDESQASATHENWMRHNFVMTSLPPLNAWAHLDSECEWEQHLESLRKERGFSKRPSA